MSAAAHLAALLAAGLLVAGPQTPDVDLGSADPALVRLFTPLSAPPGEYAVYQVARPIQAVAAELKARDPAPAAGAWAPTRPEAHDAFGQAGLYDRYQLAQLFGGQRLTVIRGSLRDGRVQRAYTLISPYPDATLSTIRQGTMVIVVTLGLAGGQL